MAQMVDVSRNLRYLQRLAKEFPNIQAASTEIINLQAILELPKGTEHFMSDIHGEADAFLHILNNCSGNIRNKITQLYQDRMSKEEIAELSTLVYYPERKIEKMKKQTDDLAGWYKVILTQLVELCRVCGSKYTRSKVRKALPKDFEYIIDELLHADYGERNKELYYSKILQSIIDIDRADAFIIAICNVIKRLVVDSLHIVGDLFDRGPHPDIILDRLIRHHAIDIQWGNHDALWMGAAAGSGACIATLLSNTMKYNNLDLIEDGYGINLLPLAVFANATYVAKHIYFPVKSEQSDFELEDLALVAKMRKAIAIIQFKLEGQLIQRHPDYRMEERLLLDKIDYAAQTVRIGNQVYPMLDTDFPTVNRENPYQLTPAEEKVMDQLIQSFRHSERLQKHIRFLYSVGSMYKVTNGNLLFHGCMPMNEDGSFQSFEFEGITFSGKPLYDRCDVIARQGYYGRLGSQEKQKGEDFLWWLWCGKDAPTVGRKKMTTFERLFIEDKATHKEPKNPYYKYQDNEEACLRIMKEFGFTKFKYAHIINGHMPVAVKSGETPVKANGKMIIIDGGFCRAYHHTTGIAGYTMFFNSWGIRLAAHEPFVGLDDAIENNKDILSTSVIYESASKRLTVGMTDIGMELNVQVEELKQLLHAYRSGLIKER